MDNFIQYILKIIYNASNSSKIYFRFVFVSQEILPRENNKSVTLYLRWSSNFYMDLRKKTKKTIDKLMLNNADRTHKGQKTSKLGTLNVDESIKYLCI